MMIEIEIQVDGPRTLAFAIASSNGAAVAVGKKVLMVVESVEASMALRTTPILRSTRARYRVSLLLAARSHRFTYVRKSTRKEHEVNSTEKIIRSGPTTTAHTHISMS